MFKVEDAIIYGTQGICKIESIEEKDLTGTKRMYYVLIPVYQTGCKIYVPVDNEKLVSTMKKLLSKEEIVELINNMPNDKVKWIANDNIRKEHYKEVLKEGNRESLIALIKSVYLHKQKLLEEGKKKLHVADENAMKEAEKLLYDEFAYVLNIERGQVLPYIMEQIMEES